MNPTPVRRPSVSVLATEQDVLLYDMTADTDHVLNPTAFAIWELCDGTTTVEEMVAGVCDLFGLEPDRAVADIEHAIEELAAADLIDVPPSTHRS